MGMGGSLQQKPEFPVVLMFGRLERERVKVQV